MKFYLNREIPREQFVFAIRSFSGQVSWDKLVALGATYDESDESITHQIVDRPMPAGAKTYINRVYIQPQWIFDCINENMILPHEDYLPGALLPPHLSPFVEHVDGAYIPPEKQKLIKMKLGIAPEESVIKPQGVAQVPVKKTENQKPNTESNGSQKSDKKKEKKTEENDEDDDDVYDGMKVDLDSPDEEESEEEEDQELDSDDEETLKKNKTEVG